MDKAKQAAFLKFKNSGFWQFLGWASAWATIRAIESIEAEMLSIKTVAKHLVDEEKQEAKRLAAEDEAVLRQSRIRSARI